MERLGIILEKSNRSIPPEEDVHHRSTLAGRTKIQNIQNLTKLPVGKLWVSTLCLQIGVQTALDSPILPLRSPKPSPCLQMLQIPGTRLLRHPIFNKKRRKQRDKLMFFHLEKTPATCQNHQMKYHKSPKTRPSDLPLPTDDILDIHLTC